MEQPKRVGIWIRVSTDMQVRDESPEHHEQRARYYIQGKGWHVAEVYRLDAVSGKAVMHHPEAQRMIKDIQSKHIEGLVFSKLARLARSTKELLEFAEIFRNANADLISLAESIDTSTPAGRLFFTIISAMAEWEREEIGARVSASVAIRAKLGKPLGGQASFGYKWHEKELVIDENEAPVRKLMYEIFLKTQRKKTTADELNKLGYRTRNGSKFSDNTIDRLLRDNTARGERIANYTKSLGDKKQWVIKPESEWVRIPCPAIISEETWNHVNTILKEQERKSTQVAKKTVYLLSGFVKCACSKTMYVIHRTQTYQCNDCKRRITVSDIDSIFQDYLNEYLESINTTDFLTQSASILRDRESLLIKTKEEREKLSKRLEKFLAMRLDEEISKEQFAEHYQPLNARLGQLDTTIPELQAEVDFLKIQVLSGDIVLSEAEQLATDWVDMSFENKITIVETIIDHITIDEKDITIELTFIPTSFMKTAASLHTVRDSSRPLT